MKHTSIIKEFLKYVSLNVFGMIGLSCYILADTFFVSLGLGVNGLAALNLAIPIYSFIHGSGLMLGMGGATRYSMLKSQGNAEQGNRTFTNTIILASGFAVFFLITGILFSGVITQLLGADEAVFKMSKTYLKVILLFAPMFILNNVLLCFVRNDGAPQLSMAAMLGGSLSNIILDYIFIFPFGMGIFGAVLATGLAPVVSIIILSPYFKKRKNGFQLIKCTLNKPLVHRILSCGVPSLITEVSSGVVILIFNTIILRLQGNTGVAAYGVIANLSLVVTAIYTGIAQGIQPLVSSSYGRGDIAKAKTVNHYALITMFSVSIVLYLGIFFGAGQVVSVFNSERNELLQTIAVSGMKIYFSACLFTGFNIIMSIYFTATDYPHLAHIIAVLRGFLLIIPMAFLLSALGGMTGVWSAFLVTEIVTSVFGFAFYKRVPLKKACRQQLNR